MHSQHQQLPSSASTPLPYDSRNSLPAAQQQQQLPRQGAVPLGSNWPPSHITSAFNAALQLLQQPLMLLELVLLLLLLLLSA
jgi:hypothetical protein